MSPPRPNLFIPGAPKSGTTSLADYLSARPDVYLGPLKEPNFWSDDLPHFALIEGLRSSQDYFSLYARAPAGTRYVLDASTHYLYSRTATDRILRNLPDPRFLVCIRDHAEIAHAWHMQMFNAGYENVTDFEEAWSLLERRRAGERIPDGCPDPKLLDYFAIASIGEQLDRLLARVGNDRVHVILLDELKQDPRAVYLGVLAFLGLDDDGRTEFPASNVSHQSRSKLVSRLVRSPRFRPWLNRIWRALGPGPTQAIKVQIKRGMYRTVARRPMSDAFRATLDEAFAGDALVLDAAVARNRQ